MFLLEGQITLSMFYNNWIKSPLSLLFSSVVSPIATNPSSYDRCCSSGMSLVALLFKVHQYHLVSKDSIRRLQIPSEDAQKSFAVILWALGYDVYDKFVTHALPFLKPCCLLFIRLFTNQTIDVRDTVLYFPSSSRDTFLKISETFACFHLLGHINWKDLISRSKSQTRTVRLLRLKFN